MKNSYNNEKDIITRLVVLVALFCISLGVALCLYGCSIYNSGAIHNANCTNVKADSVKIFNLNK